MSKTGLLQGRVGYFLLSYPSTTTNKTMQLDWVIIDHHTRKALKHKSTEEFQQSTRDSAKQLCRSGSVRFDLGFFPLLILPSIPQASICIEYYYA